MLFSDRDHTVYAEMLTVFEPVLTMQDRLSEMEARMADGGLLRFPPG